MLIVFVEIASKIAQVLKMIHTRQDINLPDKTLGYKYGIYNETNKF